MAWQAVLGHAMRHIIDRGQLASSQPTRLTDASRVAKHDYGCMAVRCGADDRIYTERIQGTLIEHRLTDDGCARQEVLYVQTHCEAFL